MTRQFVGASVVLAIINGIFSPWLLMVFVFYPLWYPTWAPAISEIVIMLSSLILSTLTLMASGVPAALYERFARRDDTDQTSALIWFVCAVLLTLPSLPGVMRALGMAAG